MIYLFLDFDGVMHVQGNYSPKFEHLDAFCLALRPYLNNLRIVISSSWREVYSFDDIQSFFPEDFQPIVIGVTPIIENNLNYEARYNEIVQWCREQQVAIQDCIILDDMKDLFPASCPGLILVNSKVGLSEDNLQEIIIRLEA